jgi:hypothetical protein
MFYFFQVPGVNHLPPIMKMPVPADPQPALVR